MQTTIDTIWVAAQELLGKTVSEQVYNLWFAPLRAIRQDVDGILVAVTNEYCEMWLKDNYLSLLQDTLAQVTGQPTKIKFQVDNQPLTSASPIAAVRAKTRNGKPAHPLVDSFQERIFNPNYTFETLVVGNHNQFAHAAALAVAQTPGKTYNPLYVYGGVGLGKTHLLQAIGQHIAQTNKTARVAYVTSEKFTNEFIEAIQNSQLVRFRNRYRQIDILLVDDIQFLAGKERIQEEFFHTFNALHENRKQIVLSCDRPAGELQNLEQRLVSRFEWGLVTDLQAPDEAARLAILRRKETGLGVKLPEEVLQFIARQVRTNIRRLEGALIRVASYASLTGKLPTLELAEELLREILHEERRYTLTIDTIQKRVAERFDIRLGDMTSKRRPEHIAFPRQVAMFLAHQMTELSLTNIGEAFGGRDHGTVIHACRSVKDRMDVDPSIRQVVHHLETQLRQ